MSFQGYRLDFSPPNQCKSPMWNGSAATVCEDDDPEARVWGAIWEIDLTHMSDLDRWVWQHRGHIGNVTFGYCRQEGVHQFTYFPLIKGITLPNGETIECRLYQISNAPTEKIDLTESNTPFERQPSQTYIETIVKGAIESELPAEYIEFLRNITHNKELACLDMLEKLKCDDDETIASSS